MAEQETITLGIVGIKNMGVYNSATNYEKLNVVTYQGSSYCALKNSKGIVPTDTEYWQLYAGKGDTGDTGPQGIQGETGPKGDTGNPGASPIVVSSSSAMTDTSRIYVNSTDGHWYWYNGSNWIDGGVYQANGVDKNDPVIVDLQNDINDVRIEVSTSDINDYEQGTYDITNGEPTSSNFGVRLKNTQSLSKGIYKAIASHNNYRFRLFIYDSDDNLKSVTAWINNDLTFFINDGDSIKYYIGQEDGGYFYINNFDASKFSIIKLDDLNNEYNFTYGTLSNQGEYVKSYERIVSDFIKLTDIGSILYKIECNGYYVAPHYYDTNKNFIGVTNYAINGGTYYTNFKACYVRLLVKANPDNLIDNLIPDYLNLKINKIGDYNRYTSIFNGITFENGSINSDGSEVQNNIRVRTQYIPVLSTAFYKLDIPASPEFEALCILYDINKNVIGKAFDYTHTDHIINGFNGFVRFIFRRYPNTDTDINPSEIVNSGFRFIQEISTNGNAIETKKIKVMTNNVGHWAFGNGAGYDGADAQEKLNDWIEHFTNEKYNLIGLQEYYPSFDRNNNLDTSYNMIKYVSNKIFTGSRDQALLPLGKLSDIEEIDLGSDNDLTNHRTCLKGYYTIGDKKIAIFNTHLISGNDTLNTLQKQTLINLLSAEPTFICFGDFNITTPEGYNDFKNAGFKLANCGDFGVFNTYIYSDLPLDNIITSSNIAIKNVEMITNNVTSDHRALVAELIVPNIDYKIN